MNFLCPSCRTPLPRAGPEHVTCTGCGVAVDLTRVDTAPGQARLWPEIDLSGEALSGYALLKLLGSGGMGSVYEARGPDGAIVAIKVLSPLLAAEPALRERFRREARALAAISHQGVVKMLGEGEEQGFCWYSMERITGQDLRARLKSGPLAIPEVIALGTAMLDALEVVHAGGFIHRDVKPSNILLAPEGPKLCDFGIARFEGASTLTESAALLGSLRYMAPEQRWGKSDARSDLYALGVVLHEALALGVPGEKPLPDSTPARLARAIARLTQGSPVLRPQSAFEAKRLLINPSARPGLLAAAALVLLAAAGTAFALGVQSFKPDSPVVEVVVDAGPALAVVVKAGQVALDAGHSELAAAALPDAGEEADAGSALAEGVRSADAGPLLALFRGASSKPPPKGKPVSKSPVKLTETLLGTAPLDSGSLGTKGTAGPKKKSKAPDATPLAEILNGRLFVNGDGPATVFDGRTELGLAPGDFSLKLGGHAIFVVCEGKKAQGFKVSLGGKSGSQTITYSCAGK